MTLKPCVFRRPSVLCFRYCQRTAFDQLLFAPLFIPCFMSSLLALEGDIASIPSRLRTSWAETVLANWVVWTPAQLINFRFVPLSYQVLFGNCVGFGWNMILSFQATKPTKGPS
mmetsp:Transcript_26299/g.58879  ORF Transcript_26299/g.58879 Transcript_26299/m.58879 type:complete len:114 (+) Transcript_26299:430-771(+)